MTTTDEILETLNRLKKETEMAINLVKSGPLYDCRQGESGRLDFRIGDFIIIDQRRINTQYVFPPKKIVVDLH